MSPGAADRVELKPYKPGDAQQVKSFVLSILEGEFNLTYRRKDLEAIQTEYAPPGSFVLMREIGTNRLIGTAGLCLATRLAEPLPAELEGFPGPFVPLGNLRRMYLAPSFRGQGLGLLLYNHIEGLARKAGCVALYLDTDPSMGEARRFYHRRGFQPLSSPLIDPGPLSEGCLNFMVKLLNQQA